MFVYDRVPVRKNQYLKQIITSACNVRTAAFSIMSALMLSVAIPAITMAAPMDGTNNDKTVTAGEVENALQDTAGLLGQSDSVKTTSDSDSAIKVATAGASIDIPKDASDGVTLQSSGGPTLDIELPNADKAKDAQPVAPGVVSYASGNGSANAVQATEDGGVRMLTIIDNPNAPTEYDYKITVPNGGHIELADDGGAVVLGANQELIASVVTPWSKDANDIPIETWFTTDGHRLTQHIKHNVEGVAYPVTADPYISWGWNMYVNFTWSETRTFMRYQELGYFGTGMMGIVCGRIPHWGAQAACGAFVAAKGYQLNYAVRRAAETGSCLQLTIPYSAVSHSYLAPIQAWFGWKRC